MEAARWRRALGTVAVVAALGSLGLGGPASPDVANTPWQPPPCPVTPATAATPAVATHAWFRLSPVLDATGTLAGQRLTVGLQGGVRRTAELPAESFAAGPVDGMLVIGDDDGSRSRVRVVDVVRECVRLEAFEAAVVRSAILASGLDEIWEHRVSRSARDDLGVWRRPLGPGEPTQILPGLEPDPAHGPTFATDLRPTADGRLVAASCGALVCRTRVFDPGTAGVVAVDGTGPALGFAAGRLVAYAACGSVECPIVAIEPATGAATWLVDASGPAELGGPGDRWLLYLEDAGTLAVVDVATLRRTSSPAAAGLVPVRRGSTSTAGADLAPGALLLAPWGGFTDPAQAATIDPASDLVEPLEEAQR